mmetsp:Transcript_62118/g.134870  ORF Transcript_62118/g.134870 Transcript_62118/m.134870 type:complete len:104 (+) Transcript_62118:316-627(+)
MLRWIWKEASWMDRKREQARSPALAYSLQHLLARLLTGSYALLNLMSKLLFVAMSSLELLKYMESPCLCVDLLCYSYPLRKGDVLTVGPWPPVDTTEMRQRRV